MSAQQSANEEVHYHEYLKLDQLLSAQQMESAKKGSPAHDEMLFIVIHQTYELWFKLILHEVGSILEIFRQPPIPESSLGTVLNRFNRVIEIFKVLVQQIRVLNTMTPLDFLGFRAFLSPASGFQSFQFRLLENKLGLRNEQRLSYRGRSYKEYFPEHQKKELEKTEQEDSLIDVVNRWLERTPFLNFGGFDFWKEYCSAIERRHQEEEAEIMKNSHLTDETREAELEELKKNQAGFEAFLKGGSMAAEEEACSSAGSGGKGGRSSLTHKAKQAALLIYLYRDQPALQLPFRVLTALTEIDTQLIAWRHEHALLVQRMIGAKMGTGGSSGFHYLRSTTSDRYKVFLDLANISTFLIPRQSLPDLPPEAVVGMSYKFEQTSLE